jgi:hypothetical protein
VKFEYTEAQMRARESFISQAKRINIELRCVAPFSVHIVDEQEKFISNELP